MAKSNSPIRLDAELMNQAKLAGAVNRRSQAEQIEYWASIGRSVAKLIDPETLVRIKSGVTSIALEDRNNGPVDPDDVFQTMSLEQSSGSLKEKLTTSSVRYQASDTHSGFLEQIDSKGNVVVGSFVNGTFTPKA